MRTPVFQSNFQKIKIKLNKQNKHEKNYITIGYVYLFSLFKNGYLPTYFTENLFFTQLFTQIYFLYIFFYFLASQLSYTDIFHTNININLHCNKYRYRIGIQKDCRVNAALL